VPLRPLSTAIWKLILNGCIPATYRGAAHGRNGLFDDVGSSGLRVLRRYCPRCGSPVTTEPDLTPDILFLKSGGLDQTEWLHPTLELFVGRRLPWVLPIPDAVQFDGNPQV